MTPIERAARALCEAAIIAYEPNEETRTKAIDELWPSYLDMARATIAAIREPSESMVEAYNQHDLAFVHSGWCAAIDALLAEGQPISATATFTLRADPDWDKPIPS